MVRTKADVCAKAAGAKSSRKPLPSVAQGSSGIKSKRSCDGNPYFPRETPAWQREITKFFHAKSGEASEDKNSLKTVKGPVENDEKMTENKTRALKEENDSAQACKGHSKENDAFEELLPKSSAHYTECDKTDSSH